MITGAEDYVTFPILSKTMAKKKLDRNSHGEMTRTVVIQVAMDAGKITEILAA